MADPDEQVGGAGMFMMVDTGSSSDGNLTDYGPSSDEELFEMSGAVETQGDDEDTDLYDFSERAHSDLDAGGEEVPEPPRRMLDPDEEIDVVVGREQQRHHDDSEVEPQQQDMDDDSSEGADDEGSDRRLDAPVMYANVEVVEPVSVALEPEIPMEGQEGMDDLGTEGMPTHPPLHPSASSGLTSFSSYDAEKSFFFSFMAEHPWIFVALVPIIFSFLVGFGWSNKQIEDQIDDLWIPEDGSYARDQKYASQWDMDQLRGTILPGMAASRDGKNLMTADRLEAIRARMQATEENTVVEYKGINFTWYDICAETIAPYESPCLRLSPMDLYKEARWTFTPDERSYFYKELVQKVLIAPRLPRFGILQTQCTQECAFVLAYRTDPASVGYPDVEPSPLSLVADVGNLEYNDPCRICIEDKYEATIEKLHAGVKPAFTTLQGHVIKASSRTSPGTQQDRLNDIADRLGQLAESVTTTDVAEFYAYYVTRQLYGELGVGGYLETYGEFDDYIGQCLSLGVVLGLSCPLPLDEVDDATATQHLLNHADNAFSSVVTSGAPYPFWSEADGTGELLKANEETGLLYPVSGSGVNMSAPIDSLPKYLAYLYLQPTELADPDSREWKDMVESNPLYAWLMAGVTPAEEGTMCANGNLTGTNTGVPALDEPSNTLLANSTPIWCTEYDVPNTNNTGPEGTVYTKQHFARMWYDLLVASPNLLDFKHGTDDPYSWTTGAGCGYNLGEGRFSYINQTEEDILHNSSRILYNIDEGTLLGAIDRSMLIGGVIPAVGEYDFENPLREVTVLQNLYVASLPADIVTRVKHCKRPGGPVDLTWEEARELLEIWKETMENQWNKGWDNETDGEIQFVCYFGEGGDALGSTGRMLKEVTLDNDRLTTIAIIAIAVFSILFLFSLSPIESRVLLMVIGVALVVFSYYAGTGFALIINMKVNMAVGWTLPFIILGLGVDDVYIVLLAIKKQGGCSKNHWLKAMKEVAVPVTMTSLVNASIVTIMNLSDIPVVYATARIALFCIIALYVSVLFCFPAFCYLDLKRQEAGRIDVAFCLKSTNPPPDMKEEDFRNTLLYENFFKPIVLGENAIVRSVVHGVIFLVSFAAIGVGVWGITERDVGIGLEQFYPSNYPAARWASLRTEYLSSWTVAINWGENNYTDINTQMRMIGQFEEVIATPAITEVDTKQLWIADLLIWTSRHCDENFDRENFGEKKCGRDQVYEGDGSTCTGSWVSNVQLLREKNFQDITDEVCLEYEGGICRPRDQMHADDLMKLDKEHANAESFCPVIDGWSDSKWKFCLERWRTITGVSHRFVLEDEFGSATECDGVYNQDESIAWPLPVMTGPTMFAVNMFTHQDTVDMIVATRAICDDDEEVHCWMSGVPYDYWAQYDGIFEVLLTLASYAVIVATGISFIFLFGKLIHEKNHPVSKIVMGSAIGALLIGAVIIMSLVTVVGFGSLAGVNLTGFSNLSFLLSIGFSVEYSVHIVSRWMRANMKHTESLDRVDYTMSFLMLPTFMSFVSSTIGVICLAFTDLEFNTVYFFRPLIIVMAMSYWYGCWFLPTLLVYFDFDAVKLGKPKRKSQKGPSARDDLGEMLGVLDEQAQDTAASLRTHQPPQESFAPAPAPHERSILVSPRANGQMSRRPAPDPPTSPTMLIRPEGDVASE